MSFDGVILVGLIIMVLVCISEINKSENKLRMTENSLKVYKFLCKNKGHWYSTREIAKILNVSLGSVTGANTGLVNKGYVYRTRLNGEVIQTITEEGIENYKNYKEWT